MKALISMLLAASMLAACNTQSDKQEALLKSQQKTIDSMRVAMEKQAIIDSMNALQAQRQEAEKWEDLEKTEATNHTHTAASAPAPAVAQAPAKKKWSHTAKGALVGAGTGAITGAIVNKKRVEGALIGTVIGAGVGAGTGAIVDHTVKKRQQQ
ncbi:glycine zipper family protein [Dyadobacter fermentans]|uniref:glycine zipper family protein n=1 Tax=Dyadobacter fermentans TaxID=94254 RepID=UPI001CBFC9DF|nr:glycine zipper family protein [Dyadobacter fermentans]MBZ1360551.1 glycine zipper family protein [Dyadobacter fermentans]